MGFHICFVGYVLGIPMGLLRPSNTPHPLKLSFPFYALHQSTTNHTLLLVNPVNAAVGRVSPFITSHEHLLSCDSVCTEK